VVVHHRRFPLGFPMRSVTQRATDDRGISRFPCEMFPCMRGVSDRAGSKRVSRYRRTRCCLPLSSTASAPRSTRRSRGGACISRLDTQPALPPVNASLPRLPARSAHDSGPAWVASPSPYETSIHYTSPV
jgi:hypothetical protein